MITVLTILPRHTYFQIVSQMWCTIVFFSYFGAVRPYKTSITNKQEIFNEAVVLIASYPLLAFTDWIWELDKKKDFGWMLVSCIIISFLVNVGLIIYIACGRLKFNYKVCRTKIIKWKRAKAAQEEKNRKLAEEQELAEKKKAEQEKIERYQKKYNDKLMILWEDKEGKDYEEDKKDYTIPVVYKNGMPSLKK